MRIPTGVLVLALLAGLIVGLVACAPNVAPVQHAPLATVPTTSTFTQSTSESASFAGNSGTTETFTLMGGTYVIDQSAGYDAANDPSGSGQCFFAGELDNLAAGTKTALGSSGPVLPSTPLATTTRGTFSRGTFKLDIYSETTCDWGVTIVQNGG